MGAGGASVIILEYARRKGIFRMEKGYCEFVFNCPYHGIERAVFCFRAFQPTYRDRWFKWKYVPEVVGFGENELEDFLDNWKEGMY